MLLDLKAMNLECRPMEEERRSFSIGEEWAHSELYSIINLAGAMEWEETRERQSDRNIVHLHTTHN